MNVYVPGTIRGDLDGNSYIDQDDINIILSDIGFSATKPADARDLNSNGQIDRMDAKILEGLCTRPPCVSNVKK